MKHETEQKYKQNTKLITYKQIYAMKKYMWPD